MRIGTDIVEVSRIKRAITNWQNDFLQRVFTQQENTKINREDPKYE
ncbi:4'-phosphopantetheinyl transferase superfamily protein, partial [Enterobacter hormaechei]